jgi:Zinc carboxypeptidase
MRWRSLIVLICLAVFPVRSSLLAQQTARQAQQANTSIDWTHYHNYVEMSAMLRDFAAKYKDLTKLYSIGKSFQGKDLWCLEITNYAKGAPETKPGEYIDGNTHAVEVSGTETSLYIINHLLSNYGKDPLITRLVDTRTFYVVPRVNPDGSEVFLARPGIPPDADMKKVQDLNGDGIISTMRIHDEYGPFKTSPKDPRLMVPRRLDEKGEWRVIGPEGMDTDNRRMSEDPRSTISTVTNRNYPAFWAPNWVQGGSLPGGDYPLSEPEAKAIVDFISAHQNIASIQSYHTHSGAILRPYSNQGDDLIPRQDMDIFMRIGAIGTELTGYPVLSIYNDFTPGKSNPRRGVFNDWAYENFGAFALTTEIWRAPGEVGKTVFDTFDESVAMEFNDRELGGKAFVNWQKFKHPQYGEVEIGGWNMDFFTTNPPPKFAEAEWKKNCLFEIKRAELLPQLQVTDVKQVSLGDRLVRITAVITNEGVLPTNITQKAIDHHIARPTEVRLELEKAELLEGRERTDIGHIVGTLPPAVMTDYNGPRVSVPRNQRSVEWLVRLKGDGASARITASSPRAGTASKKVMLATP